MSLTNPKNVVTEERLSEFYQQILPYLGGMPEALANKFAKGDLYSTDEKIVGCWTDGKPLYQKTIEISSDKIPNSNSTTITSGVPSNMDTVVNVFGLLRTLSSVSSYTWTPIPRVQDQGTDTALIGIDVATNVPAIYLKGRGRNFTTIFDKGYVTIQYTKTTDAANSFKYANETDYSTDEKIVGTWIDGKPLYQKTFDFGALPDSTTKSLTHGISNFKNLIDIKSWFGSPSSHLYGIIPYASDYNENHNSVEVYVDNTAINIRTAKDQTGFSICYITLQYTKTTD